MYGPISRILLRVGVGFLIGKAVFTPEDGNALVSDPEIAALVEAGLAAGVWAATEYYYKLAKKFGWAT